MEHTNCHSPGDFEENDTFLKKLQDEKHILALCDVTISIFKCTTIYYRYLSIHCLQSFLLNVKILFSYQADLGSLLLMWVVSWWIKYFQKAKNLRAWYITYFTNIFFVFTLTKMSPLSTIIDHSYIRTCFLYYVGSKLTS